MIIRLLALMALIAAAQESRVPTRAPGPTGKIDVSDYANPGYMRILLTSSFETLEGIGRSNQERSRIRGYMFGLLQQVGRFLYTAGPGGRPCPEISSAVADQQLYLNGWVRDYVRNNQANLLRSATRGGALGPTGIAAGQAEFADLQDIIVDGRTDGTRLVKELRGCDAPSLKTILASAHYVRSKFPSGADVYIPTMPTKANLESFAGQYSVEQGTDGVGGFSGTVTVSVTGSNLTLTDSKGRSFELRPQGDTAFVIPGDRRGRATFDPVRGALAFNQGDLIFIAHRVDGPLDLQSVAGQYVVISGLSRRVKLVVADLSGPITVAVNGSGLTLTDAQGRSHALRPSGSNEFVIGDTPQAIITFFVRNGTMTYKEGTSVILLRR